MTLLRLPGRGAAPAFTGRVATGGGRRQQKLVASLAGALDRLAAAAEQPGVQTLDVQLLVQVCGAASYPAWRDGRERAWRQLGSPFSTQSWTGGLDEPALAGLLLALQAGRVGRAVGAHPRTVADPLFATGLPTAEGRHD
ncbi:MAG TPA: hypothetical protein VIL49_07210, partial [Capillimicrobium sp.]